MLISAIFILLSRTRREAHGNISHLLLTANSVFPISLASLTISLVLPHFFIAFLPFPFEQFILNQPTDQHQDSEMVDVSYFTLSWFVFDLEC